MRSALALILVCALSTGAGADTHRLRVKGSGSATLTRPHPQGDLTIQVPGEFEAALTLVPGDGAWRTRDADLKATILGQSLRLRLTPPPDDQVYIEINDGAAAWGTRSDLAGVPLLGGALAVGGVVAEDATLQVEFLPVESEDPSALRAVLRLPGGGDLLWFPVTLGAQNPSDQAQPWTASGLLEEILVPLPGEREFLVHRLAWTADGQVGSDPQPLTASLTFETEFALPGEVRGTLKADVEVTLDRVTPPAAGP